MKNFLIALLLLFGIVVITLISSCNIDSMKQDMMLGLSELEVFVNEENWDSASEKQKELNDRWRRSKFGLFISANTIEIEAIDMCIRRMKTSLELEEKTELLMETTELKKLIEYLALLEGLNMRIFL